MIALASALLLTAQLGATEAPVSKEVKIVPAKDKTINLGEWNVNNNIDDPTVVDISGLEANINLDLEIDRSLLGMLQKTEDREARELYNGEL